MARVRSRGSEPDSGPKGKFNSLKSLIGLFLVIALLISAFWLSFLLGKRMLIPIKNLPVEEAASVLQGEGLAKDVFVTQEVVVELGEKRLGLEEVEELLPETGEEEKPVEEGRGAFPYKVQAGFFQHLANAKALSEDLKKQGFDNFIKALPGGFYRVQVGALGSRPEAQAQVRKLKAAGFEAIIIYSP